MEKVNLRKWKEAWKVMALTKGKIYALISEKPLLKYEKELTRKEITTFCGIRTQHGGAQQHLTRIDILNDDRCPCGEIGNLQHIILECISNQRNINVLYNKLSKFICKDYSHLQIF